MEDVKVNAFALFHHVLLKRVTKYALELFSCGMTDRLKMDLGKCGSGFHVACLHTFTHLAAHKDCE
jgi:hypothetical protein